MNAGRLHRLKVASSPRAFARPCPLPAPPFPLYPFHTSHPFPGLPDPGQSRCLSPVPRGTLYCSLVIPIALRAALSQLAAAPRSQPLCCVALLELSVQSCPEGRNQSVGGTKAFDSDLCTRIPLGHLASPQSHP